jgi:hypothetical protein
MVCEFVAHDSSPSVRGLNHGPAVDLNSQDISVTFPQKGTHYALWSNHDRVKRAHFSGCFGRQAFPS